MGGYPGAGVDRVRRSWGLLEAGKAVLSGGRDLRGRFMRVSKEGQASRRRVRNVGNRMAVFHISTRLLDTYLFVITPILFVKCKQIHMDFRTQVQTDSHRRCKQIHILTC